MNNNRGHTIDVDAILLDMRAEQQGVQQEINLEQEEELDLFPELDDEVNKHLLVYERSAS